MRHMNEAEREFAIEVAKKGVLSLYKKLKVAEGYKARPPPAVKLLDGSFAKTPGSWSFLCPS